MKKILLILFLFLSFYTSFATHTKGGWMYYEYLGPGISNPANLRYRIGLNFYMDCPSTVIENSFNFSIFNGGSPFNFVQDVAVNLGTTNNIQNCSSTTCYPCINNIPVICYKILNYETIVELPPSAAGYIVAKQRCCRVNNISNLLAPSNTIGATYTISIPGTVNGLSNAHQNASPRFIFNDTSIVCANNLFSLSFAATDSDADSLVYSFCDTYSGASQTAPNPATSSNPPFSLAPYQFPFSGTNPLGAAVSINPQTGIINGMAPAPGEYVVTICVAEYRNGIRFAESRKELHLKVTACTPVLATMDPTFLTCGDLTLSFFNQSDNPAILNWYWEFGDPASGANDSSLLQMPNHTFSAAGDYTIKLIVNRGLPCIDSTTQIVRVYPGFFPGFQNIGPTCAGVPVQFSDTTKTNHGTVSYWKWDFGDPATLADTSRIRNPTYTYPSPGSYTVKLISGNSLGCRDSITTTIVVNSGPVLTLLSADSSYCGLDSLPLAASGTGSFSWSPVTNIIGANTANPIVFPTVPTTYVVTLNDQGCIRKDSLRITPLFDLSNSISAMPATICQDDTLMLSGSSNKTNNLSWQWTPAGQLSSASSQQTQAYPQSTTTYTLQTRWGNHCVATATINVPVTALAIPNAGPDASFCTGQQPVQLMASGGNTYSWSPSTGLSNPSVANPIANPLTSTQYIVSVGVNGCSKTRADTINVTVRPKPIIAITNDTLICTIDTLQLNVTGAGTVLWTPNYMINNTSSPSPLVSPDVPTKYKVRYTDNFGCFINDSVFVDVKALVTINAGNDTTICQTDGFSIRTTGDALSYNWIPSLYLSNDTIKNPVANPPVTTTYTVIGNIGKCQAQSQVTIKVAPYPAAYAGRDTSICFGLDIQLNASGGSRYLWTPSNYLSNTQIANPIVRRPRNTIQYIVTVTDTLGCPKPVKDTIMITVVPPILVDAGPRDTSIVDGELLYLNATGALTYTWSPGTWLSATNIANPIASPTDSILYIVNGRDKDGCLGSDSIMVRVYQVDPDMFVPTAFTPNGDGLNDLARPIMLGMKSLSYFRIYNRFGELMFATTEIGKGWNGIHKGKPQDAATFVWMAEGVTFKGEKRKKKGYVILIR